VQQIVDDDALFVKVAQTLLEPDGVTVAGVASTCAEAVERVGALRPDVVLIDVRSRDSQTRPTTCSERPKPYGGGCVDPVHAEAERVMDRRD
jgi:CheY-like chemotaxis protein